jgi:hypothetical protein
MPTARLAILLIGPLFLRKNLKGYTSKHATPRGFGTRLSEVENVAKILFYKHFTSPRWKKMTSEKSNICRS